jgi:hypothetical protein
LIDRTAKGGKSFVGLRRGETNLTIKSYFPNGRPRNTTSVKIVIRPSRDAFSRYYGTLSACRCNMQRRQYLQICIYISEHKPLLAGGNFLRLSTPRQSYLCPDSAKTVEHYLHVAETCSVANIYKIVSRKAKLLSRRSREYCEATPAPPCDAEVTFPD